MHDRIGFHRRRSCLLSALLVAVNGGSAEAILLPFTLGDWQESKPITIDLRQGTNTLQVYRITPPQAGIAVKSFTLKPVK